MIPSSELTQLSLPEIVRYEPIIGIVEAIKRSPKKIVTGPYLEKKLFLSQMAVERYCQMAEVEGLISKLQKRGFNYYFLPSENDQDKYAKVFAKRKERNDKKSLVWMPWLGRFGRPRTKNGVGKVHVDPYNQTAGK